VYAAETTRRTGTAVVCADATGAQRVRVRRVVRTTGEARRAAGLAVALALRVLDEDGGVGGGESGEKHAAAYYYYFNNTRVLPL